MIMIIIIKFICKISIIIIILICRKLGLVGPLKQILRLTLRFPKISKIKISKRLFCSYYVNNEIIKFVKFTENLVNFYHKVLNYWCVWSFSVNKISHIWNSKSMEQNMGWFSKKKKKKENGATFGLNYIYLRLVECNSRLKRNFIWSMLLDICTLGHCKLN